MITIRDGRIYLTIDGHPHREAILISAYICPVCSTILKAYMTGYMANEILSSCVEKEDLKYGYRVVGCKGASAIHLQQNNHKKICPWEQVGSNARGIENSVTAWIKINEVKMQRKAELIAAISEGWMPGFRIAHDVMKRDLPILLYNERELLTSDMTLADRLGISSKLGQFIDSMLENKTWIEEQKKKVKEGNALRASAESRPP